MAPLAIFARFAMCLTVVRPTCCTTRLAIALHMNVPTPFMAPRPRQPRAAKATERSASIHDSSPLTASATCAMAATIPLIAEIANSTPARACPITGIQHTNNPNSPVIALIMSQTAATHEATFAPQSSHHESPNPSPPAPSMAFIALTAAVSRSPMALRTTCRWARTRPRATSASPSAAVAARS